MIPEYEYSPFHSSIEWDTIGRIAIPQAHGEDSSELLPATDPQRGEPGTTTKQGATVYRLLVCHRAAARGIAKALSQAGADTDTDIASTIR